MVNSRNKGANGEREAAKWLASKFNLAELPERNLEQVRKGGHDLVGFPPFCFEVKRQEQLELRKWWVQAVNASTQEYNVPVVLYRQNRKKWKFLISAREIGLDTGFIQLEAREFLLWAEHEMYQH